MRAMVATLNEITYNSTKGEIRRYFTKETLEQLANSAVGKPITLGFNGMSLTKITKAYVEDDCLYVEFDDTLETFNNNYIVPGFKTTTTDGEKFKTVRCMDFALTNKPADKSLKTIKECN